MGFLLGILGGAKTNSAQSPAATQLQVQTSAYGKCVTFGFGTNRVAPELIWYGAFEAHSQSTGGGGGKGGSPSGSVSYTYTASVQMAIGEGPILSVGRVWKDKKAYTDITAGQDPGFSLYTGSYTQASWPYLASLFGPVTGSIGTKHSGSLANTKYYIQCTFTSADGETLANTETTYNISSNNKVLYVKPPSNTVPFTTGWNIYVSNTATGGSGAEKKQNAAAIALDTAWQCPDTGLVNLGAVPLADTSNLSQAMPYHGISYAAAANYQLGSSPDMGNHNFEVFWSNDFGQDADASIVVNTILTNTKYGTIFPASAVGSLTAYQNYVYAANLFISPFYTDQKSCAEILTEITKLTNTGIFFSSGKLQFVPYGDKTTTANGKTYTAPSSALYTLTDDDLIPNQAAAGSAGSGSASDPLLLTRKSVDQYFNSMRLEFLNRANQYASEIVTWKDQASIDVNGLLEDGTTQGHIFCLAASAQLSMQLIGQRNAIRNQYQFTLDQRFIGLDPMDIVAASDVGLVITAQWLRIMEITENDDYTLTFMAEEYIDGTGNTVLGSFATGQGDATSYNIDPGNTNAPVIFEAPTSLTTNGGLETWIAISGQKDVWGGCDVYVSTDNATYVLAANGTNGGRQVGPARTGQLVDDITSTATTMDVDLSESFGTLTSGTAADATAGNTLCLLEKELLSFKTATLLSANVYRLSGCVRGQFGTTKAVHTGGKAFARLDTQIFKYPHTALQVGQSITIKLLSFNIYGGGEQSL